MIKNIYKHYTEEKPKAKSKGPTDAQRAAWAHAHYIIHHGTAADATRFLKYPQTVANTPPEALNEVRVLARVSLDASAPARKPKMSMPTKTSANSTTAPTTLTSVSEIIATTVTHGMDITPTAKSVTSSGRHIAIASNIIAQNGRHIAIAPNMIAQNGRHIAIAPNIIAQNGRHIAIAPNI